MYLDAKCYKSSLDIINLECVVTFICERIGHENSQFINQGYATDDKIITIIEVLFYHYSDIEILGSASTLQTVQTTPQWPRR